MTIARKLFLLCATVIAAMAFAAGSASAQETSVEFIDEPTSTACNPCLIKAEGESHIVSTFTGQQVSKCHDVFEGEIYHREDANGHAGHISNWLGTAHEVVGPGCTVTECAFPENEWEITNPGETGPNTGHMTVRFCLLSGGNEVHCNAEVKVTEVAPHLHEFTTVANCAFGTRRVEGHWMQVIDKAHPAFEVVHD
jgi:hypothetical protein